MTDKKFWCLDGYEGETSPIVDGKFAPTNGWLCNKLNELNEENKQLKKTINNQQVEIDYLAHLNSEFKEENNKLKWKLEECKYHKLFSRRELERESKELKERNNRQANTIEQLYNLIENKDWESLTGIIEELNQAEEQLQKEWGCYEWPRNDLKRL